MNGQNIPSLPPGMNLENLPDIKCEKCNNEIFDSALRIKKLSSFLTKDGNEQRFLIPVLICKKCGKVLEEESKAYAESGTA